MNHPPPESSPEGPSDRFDPARFRRPVTGQSLRKPARKLPSPRRGGSFLKGPIPLDWLAAAAGLRRHAPLAVGLLLWFEAGRRKTCSVSVSGVTLKRFGLSRYAYYRGVRSLEGAKLVAVERRCGRPLVVTILEAPE